MSILQSVLEKGNPTLTCYRALIITFISFLYDLNGLIFECFFLAIDKRILGGAKKVRLFDLL
jgi:hypothetical protein